MGDKIEINDNTGFAQLEGATEEDKLPDPDQIKPSDRTRPFSVAQFKRWRKDLMNNMNAVLQLFQRDLVTAQARVNLAWNGINAVIRALYNKGLITEEDVRQAGSDLLREAQENMRRAKAAVERGDTKVNAIPTPLEVIRDDVNAQAKRMRESDGSPEASK